jgi:hypothetical protein
MGSVNPSGSQTDVATAILHDFLGRLRADDSTDQLIIKRLGDALLVRRESSAEKLRQALFPEEDAE